MALVLDTGPILALLDAGDSHHEACVTLVEALDEPLVIVAPTLVEVDYWIRKRLPAQAWTTLVQDIAEGAYRLECLSAEDVVRAEELGRRYGDLDLGFVDAAVVTVCERLARPRWPHWIDATSRWSVRDTVRPCESCQTRDSSHRRAQPLHPPKGRSM